MNQDCRVRLETAERKERHGSSVLTALLTLISMNLSAEQMTMTTWYPAPVGVYQSLVTTGGTPSNPVNTILSRDAGNVGIGTSNPTAPLTVQTGGGQVFQIIQKSSTFSGNSYMAWKNSAGTDLSYVGFTGGGSSDFAVTNTVAGANTTINSTAPGNVLINQSGGNVGIGTTSPQVKLAVMGTLDVGDTQQHYSPFSIPFYVFTHMDNTHIAHFETDQPTGRFAIKTGLGEWDFMSGADGVNKFVLYNPTGPGYVLSVMNDGGVDIGGSRTNWGYKLAVEGSAANYTGVWATLSDVRLKRDIQPLGDALTVVRKLRPVTFHWKDEKKDKESGLTRGFIAQEVEAVVPDWVRTDPQGTKWLQTTGITAVLVGAIQDQQRTIEGQQQEIGALKSRLDTLEKKFERIGSGIEIAGRTTRD